MSKLQLVKFYVTLSYKNTYRHTCTQLLTTDYRGNGPAQQSCCHTQSGTIRSKKWGRQSRGWDMMFYVSAGLCYQFWIGSISKTLLLSNKQNEIKAIKD